MQDAPSPIVYKQITFSDDPDPKLFFDKYSQKIIVISNKVVKIYNKSGEVLKKTIPLQLKRDIIQFARVDNEMTYILLLVQNNNKEYWVSCLDLNKGCQEGNILKTDFSNVLGMFFLNKTPHANSKSSSCPSQQQGALFFILFNLKIMVISINAETKDNPKGSMTPIFTDRFSEADEVINYSYSPKHMVLCLETVETKFKFINLSNRAFYDKTFVNAIPSMKTLKNHRKTVNKSNKKQKESLVTKTYSSDKYAKCQIFLQTLYKKLYFIHLNMLEGKIVLYHVSDLNTLEVQQELPFKSSFATLQFIDNLIVVHDLQKEESIIYDIQMKNMVSPYFKAFPITNYTLLQRNKSSAVQLVSCNIVLKEGGDKNEDEKYKVSVKMSFPNNNKEIAMSSYSHNTMIYDKEIIVTGVILEETCGFSLDSIRNTTFYYTYFDAALFYQAYVNSETFEPVTNLIRRKNSRETILNALISMIIQGNRVHIINLVFRHILHLLNQSYKNTFRETTGNRDKSSNNSSSKATENASASELPKPFFKSSNKTTRITQSDVLLTFVRQFKYHPTVQPLYIIELLMHFLKSLKMLEIPIQENFNDILLSFVVKHDDMSSLLIFLQYGSIPETIGLSNYLMKKSEFNDALYQMGIDILIRLKRYDDVVNILLRKNHLKEAILFIINNNLLKKTFIKKLKGIIKVNPENKKIIEQFVDSDY